MNGDMTLGLNTAPDSGAQERLRLYINLKLASAGQTVIPSGARDDFLHDAHGLLESYREKSRLLSEYLCPPDRRIQDFLDRYLNRAGMNAPVLPSTTLVLDRHGMAREVSLPADRDHYESELVTSYRTRQGVLHNTRSDRRTTQGTFHVAEGGLPVPGEKKAVPARVFGRLLAAALQPPPALARLPFTADQAQPAELFVSLLLRPLVCPAIPGLQPAKTMEIRFFAPGSLVGNLDFVESIFGNGGNPYLPQHDAGLDPETWTGHSGCVILAPHLTALTKRELGLPHVDEATLRQQREGMCWSDPEECYNGGEAFKITARDASGVIVTLVADNYFGYCKKEVKTQVSFSANLSGLAEEEHAGGALAFVRYNHGEQLFPEPGISRGDHRFAEQKERYRDIMDFQPEGHALDHREPRLVYVPEDSHFDLNALTVRWGYNGTSGGTRLRPDHVYMLPSGYRVHMERHPGAPTWRLIGTVPEGVFCHKPCTVSGGGKSEISKSVEDAVVYGPLFVADLERDLDAVDAIFRRDYGERFRPDARPPWAQNRDSRPLLSPERSLGSVIKLLTPDPELYTEAYNQWLAGIPDYVRAMVFIIKRFYRPEWGEDWRSHFSVDFVNGLPGHELKFDNRQLVASYLRVGREDSGAWRLFKLRQDFIPAAKLQMEDDISASAVFPRERLPNGPADLRNPCVKLVANCEYRLFQRPDDAVQRGLDRKTEIDLSRPGNFLANYEPLTAGQVRDLLETHLGPDEFSPPMARFLSAAATDPEGGYTVSSAHPRLVDGRPTKNPRYLQLRQDLDDPFATYVAHQGARLHRRVASREPVYFPVQAVLPGRRNNPPDAGILPLCVYGPIHYQELPELFMDFVSSLTGKSPSTTGAGSEGALTKGPFNALRPVVDLNNALVSYILTGYHGFSSAAGHIGPHLRVDHDVSMLVPEIWARLPARVREPGYLIREGYLEPVADFEHGGRRVLASRLGYRITRRFVHDYLGRIFDNPMAALDEAILRPETQDQEAFAAGVDNIVAAQQRVARGYLEDGSVADACPPLEALLHIMAEGTWRGRDLHHSEVRRLFTREYLLASDWYQERLAARQAVERGQWQHHVGYLEAFLERTSHVEEAERLGVAARLAAARDHLQRIATPEYLASLHGTLGLDPSLLGR